MMWYFNGMKTTIDKAGRVVIPASIRQKAGLRPGMELEVISDDEGIHLKRTPPGPKLVRVGKRLVARPTVGSTEAPWVDVSKMVEEERNRWPW